MCLSTHLRNPLTAIHIKSALSRGILRSGDYVPRQQSLKVVAARELGSREALIETIWRGVSVRRIKDITEPGNKRRAPIERVLPLRRLLTEPFRGATLGRVLGAGSLRGERIGRYVVRS